MFDLLDKKIKRKKLFYHQEKKNHDRLCISFKREICGVDSLADISMAIFFLIR